MLRAQMRLFVIHYKSNVFWPHNSPCFLPNGPLCLSLVIQERTSSVHGVDLNLTAGMA